MDKVLDYAKKIISEKITLEDTCLDLTCGRGNDTLFLCQRCKKVYAFDIQDDAIKSTREKTKDYDNVILIKDSHKNLLTYVKESIKAAIYNLGYLPKGDKSITTHYQEVIESIKSVFSILQKNGVIIVVCYPGHEEGQKESIEIDKWLRKLNQKEYDVLRYEFINQINNPPYLYIIEKI